MDTKHILKSKTFWFNLLAGALVITQGLINQSIIPLNDQLYVVTLVNIGLRLLTYQGTTLHLKPGGGSGMTTDDDPMKKVGG